MITKHRLLISGSARLSQSLVPFVKALGDRLISRSNIVLVTGGLEKLEKDKPTVDRTVVESALEQLSNLKMDDRERILTLLPEKDWSKVTRFRHGHTETIPHTDHRSRRYYMVHSTDAVLTIEGHKATREIIELAWVTRKPLLPLAFTGGLSKEKWMEYREELIDQFSLTSEEVSELEREPVDVYERAELIIRIVERRLRPTCFLAMKYDDPFLEEVYNTITEVVGSRGYSTIRLDKVAITGNVVTTMWDSIRRSDLLIVDITKPSLNVFYELGIAHAINKDVIITVHSEDGKVPSDVPFDIRVHQLLAYANLDSLREKLSRRMEQR